MRTISKFLVLLALGIMLLVSCTDGKKNQKDIITGTSDKDQKELTEAVNAIVRDAETANLEGLKSIHLESDKFTKFGPRNFERQDVSATNSSELAFFGVVKNYKEEVKDLKIDIFGEVGIATYYRSVSFEQEGEENTVDLRQTLVFVRTNDGWKIAHEHGTRQW
jgi:hypothetical protein